MAPRGQAAWHSKHLVQAEKSTLVDKFKSSIQTFSHTLQGLQISGFFSTLINGFRRLKRVNRAPSGHKSRHQDKPLAHSAPTSTPNHATVGARLPPVPAAIAPRQATPTGQITQNTGVWQSQAAPITPPISARCTQALCFQDLALVFGPRLNTQRPGQIQLQKARPKATINRKLIPAPMASAGMNVPAAAITCAAPNGQAIPTVPRSR